MQTPGNGLQASVEELIALRLDARLLQLDLSRGVRSILAGQHNSRFRGRGMDYSESRQYQPGDDVRNIDWRVTARTGDPHTKVFIEERERPVFIMVDFSASLFFGTRGTYKSVLAAQAAALLCWTAVQNGDRVGGVLVSNQGTVDLKPRASRKGVLAIVSALADATRSEIDFNDAPRLNQSLQHLNAVIHPGSLVLVFSDFNHIDDQTSSLLSKIRQHNDVVACQLVDPIELSPPRAGDYSVTDGHSAEKFTIISTNSKRNRSAYKQYFDQRQKCLNKMLLAQNISLIRLINGEDIRKQMTAVFGR